ncbi:hypothetical protein Q2B95_08170 [Stenotrophomonas maltophilia]|uniref:hypothetical protein n=1 Tax=Stenotrophomonas maltophilia TaxID=40324 RepID=UPI0030B6FC1A
MAAKGSPKRALRYAAVGDMPAGMQKLYQKAGQTTASTTAPRAYRPAPSGKTAVADAGSAKGLVARGRPRHVAGEMNQTEAAYHQYLQQLQMAGEVLWFRFESVKLKLAKNTHLTIDFFVVSAAGELEAHEVKGFWEEDARVKVKVAAAMYPFRFLAVQRADGGGWKTEDFS